MKGRTSYFAEEIMRSVEYIEYFKKHGTNEGFSFIKDNHRYKITSNPILNLKMFKTINFKE